MVFKNRVKKANHSLNNLKITTYWSESPRSVKIIKRARLEDRLDFWAREASPETRTSRNSRTLETIASNSVSNRSGSYNK